MSASGRRTDRARTVETESEAGPSEERTPREIALARSRSPWDRLKRWLKERVRRVA